MTNDDRYTVDPSDKSMISQFVQPIYRVAKPFVTRIHPRVWAITGVLTGILTLLLIIYVGVTLLVDKEPVVQAKTITVDQALRAPFDLDNHLPLADDTPIDNVLPDTFGEFHRVEASGMELPTVARLISCLIDDGAFECQMNYRPQHQIIAYYADAEGNIIEVAVANYWNERVKSETMVDAVHSAGIFSRVGDFVVSATEVDYFYSTTSDWFSFTWGRGAWIFSISASTPDLLTTSVEAFPY